MTARTSAAGEHLGAGRDERLARQDRPMRGEERAERPADRREQDGARARPGRGRPTPPNADGPTRTRDADEARRRCPTTASRGSRSPRKSRPKTATQTGIIAISSAAMPDGIVCSPNATMPIPPPSSRPPTIARVAPLAPGRPDEARRGRGRCDQASRIAPGEREPDRGHEERRDRVDRDRDPEVGRAPHEVEDEHARARSGRPGRAGGRRRLA